MMPGARSSVSPTTGTRVRGPSFLLAIVAATLLWISAPAMAQEGFADSLSGFSGNSDEPINIEADALELRDGEQQAIFTGNVIVQQGETRLQTRVLRVYYSGSAQSGTATSAGGQNIERLEAEGGVIVTSGDQRATGDRGVFDATADKITLFGNVVLSQGTNVLKGRELHVDLAAGTSRVVAEAGSQGRVRGVFTPNRNGTDQ
ncbi:MAG: lipopolysaccharide transport periplasmic protein LptA [Pseudomonadota bacterium]